MKPGIGLVIWSIALAIGIAFRLGMQYIIDYGTGEFAFSSGFFVGLWLVVGGIPLVLGIRRIVKARKQV